MDQCTRLVSICCHPTVSCIDLIAENLKQTSLLIERIDKQVGNRICVELGNKKYLVQQTWKGEKYIPKVRRKSAP
jgi:hypothetical protein